MAVKTRRLCAPRKVKLLSDELLCPYNGGTAQAVIAARWKVLASPKTIDRWVHSGLFVGKRHQGRRLLHVRVKYPLSPWRGFVVTSRQALEAWMVRCEREQQFCRSSMQSRFLRNSNRVSVEMALMSGDPKDHSFRRALATIRASPDGRDGIVPGGLVDLTLENFPQHIQDLILDAAGPSLRRRLAARKMRQIGNGQTRPAQNEAGKVDRFFWGADETDPLMAAFEQLGEPGDGDSGSASG